jgi:hypothetical protein
MCSKELDEQIARIRAEKERLTQQALSVNDVRKQHNLSNKIIALISKENLLVETRNYGFSS